jgi:hypothetical protein
MKILIHYYYFGGSYSKSKYLVKINFRPLGCKKKSKSVASNGCVAREIQMIFKRIKRGSEESIKRGSTITLIMSEHSPIMPAPQAVPRGNKSRSGEPARAAVKRKSDNEPGARPPQSRSPAVTVPF